MDKLPSLPGMGSMSSMGSNLFGTTESREDIRKLLNERSVKDQMEGMKKVIGLLAKGEDCSELFPDVVKMVHEKDMLLKKLVYLYVVHYAEQQEDAALLAINNFQRDLVNESSILRTLGMRTLSSLRISVICQVVVLCVGKAIRDSSPYVRKAAVLALPKVYSLDPEQLPDIMEILERVLDDNHCMVLGAAVVAINEICPERYDLLHVHYRKICHYLVDFDEWAQVITINFLTHYARTQFADPNNEDDKTEDKTEADKGDEDSWGKSDESDSESDDLFGDTAFQGGNLDPDHRLLLSSALPLLRSRNTGVVLACASLFFYLGPKYETQIIAKHLVAICRGRREHSYVVLANIATTASFRPDLFSPHMSSFFIFDSEPNFTRLLKLEILTLLANEGNVSKIMMEMEYYARGDDVEFVTNTIQAMGRIAARIPDCADTCMRTLMNLIAEGEEEVVAESVIVMKKLLQTGQNRQSESDSEFPMADILAHLASILEEVRVPMARASITWVIGEYHAAAPLIAPDVLRILVKGFKEESSLVKLQILNLGSKQFLTNPDQTRLLFQYALELAKYDMDYDVRDRARLMRAVLMGGAPALSMHATRLFITSKPVPVVKIPNEGRLDYCLGSTSHMVAHRVVGYLPIPDFPADPPATDRTPKDAPYVPEDVKGLGDGSISSYDSESWGSGSYSDSYSDRSGSYSYSYSGGSRTHSRSGSWSGSYSGSEEGGRSLSDSWSSEGGDGKKAGEKADARAEMAAPASVASGGTDTAAVGELLNGGNRTPSGSGGSSEGGGTEEGPH